MISSGNGICNYYDYIDGLLLGLLTTDDVTAYDIIDIAQVIEGKLVGLVTDQKHILAIEEENF